MKETSVSDRKRMLLVGDHKYILQIKDYLDRSYEIITTSSSKGALEILASIIPDVIISNLLPPEMDDYEFVKIIRQDERTRLIPFLFLSAAGNRDKGLILGADVEASPIPLDVHLTQSELKVLQFVVRGFVNRNIADELNLSLRAVEGHVSNMLSKTCLYNRVELARWAKENQMV